MKNCNLCGLPKLESDFYPKLPYRCKDCHKIETGKWAKANRERRNEINRRWRQNHKPRRAIIIKASNALWAAIKKGLIIRGTICQECGSSSNIEAAHFDYSQPLNVLWLCIKCHRQWDAKSPKSSDKKVS